jgi:hypothetical protein
MMFYLETSSLTSSDQYYADVKVSKKVGARLTENDFILQLIYFYKTTKTDFTG